MALARWSFFGCDPFLVFCSSDGEARIEGRRDQRDGGQGEANVVRIIRRENPWRALSGLLEELGFGPEGRKGLDPSEPPFTSGAVGFLGYDLKHHLESLPEPACPRQTDDLWLAFHAAVGAYDHIERRLWLASRGLESGGGARAARQALDRLHRRVEEAIELSSGSRSREGAVPGPEQPGTMRSGSAPFGPTTPTSHWRSSFTPEQYREAVRLIQRHIAAGDIYQANLSQRFETEATGQAWACYKALRRSCPAPYAAFLRCGEMEILSASPEMFLRRRGDLVEARPIKGTRPRGATADEDGRLAAELLSSAKDRAELVMIVDLERNDLGRVCRTGSVEVAGGLRLESYANVHHLVATVRGRLREGTSPVELLAATFPGGSITGAPKIRAMQILDAIEPTRRGPYTGAAGYLDVSGDLDLQIAIRTGYRHGGRCWFQVGGGIVADSDPQSEYEETLAKGRLLAEALLPGEGFPAARSSRGLSASRLWKTAT